MGPPPQRAKWKGPAEVVTLVVLLRVLLLQVEVGMGVLCAREWRCTVQSTRYIYIYRIYKGVQVDV